MNCFDCKHLGAKFNIGYRCHSPFGSGSEKWVRFPGKYHCEKHPCPDFKPRG